MPHSAVTNTSSTTAQPWRARLFNEFALFDPAGNLVHLQNRKVEALLAILAVHREYGVNRLTIVEMLWPNRAAEGLASLRQALSLLRKAIGEDSIESPRGHCRLHSDFHLDCDYDHPDQGHGKAFMPGHDGEWFDAIRSEALADEPRSAILSTPASDFARTLEWMARNSPSTMYGLMREALHLTQGLPSQQVLHLLALAGNDPKFASWRAYWNAYMGEAEPSLTVRNQQLWRILETGLNDKDYALTVEVAYSLAASLIVQGSLREAVRAVEVCQRYASMSKDLHLLAKAGSIRGVLLLHQGRLEEGLAEMIRTEPLLGDSLAVAHAQAIRAFLESSFGLHDRALVTVSAPEALAKESGHIRLQLMCSVAKAQALSRVGNADETLEAILPAVSDVGSVEASFFWAYAHETVAKAYLMQGEDQLARQSFLTAREGRVHRGMPYTNFDQGRILKSDLKKIVAAS